MNVHSSVSPSARRTTAWKSKKLANRGSTYTRAITRATYVPTIGHDEACEEDVFVAAEAANHSEHAEQDGDREDDLAATEPLGSIRCQTSQGGRHQVAIRAGHPSVPAETHTELLI